MSSAARKRSEAIELPAYVGADSKSAAFINSEDPSDAIVQNVDQLHRSLSNRQIQLIAIGGSIGTALFVSIAWGLVEGGPGSLFLGFTLYSLFLSLVNNCMAEMAVFMPVSGGFIRLASHWVDESFGFMAGWNFFIYEAALIPWEISALNLVLSFWSDNIPVVAVCLACIALYAYVLDIFFQNS